MEEIYQVYSDLFNVMKADRNRNIVVIDLEYERWGCQLFFHYLTSNSEKPVGKGGQKNFLFSFLFLIAKIICI